MRILILLLCRARKYRKLVWGLVFVYFVIFLFLFELFVLFYLVQRGNVGNTMKDHGLPGVSRTPEINEEQYTLFLQCIPHMFSGEPQRYLMSNFLWGDEERTQMLISHLRLYDMIRRLYFIKFRENPSHETMNKTLRQIMSNPKLYRLFSMHIERAIFPYNYTRSISYY